MSTQSVGLKRERVAAFSDANENYQIRRTPLKPASSSCLDLSADCFLPIFGFLNPEEVALAKRVSKAWQRAINEKNQVIWKQQYVRFFPEATLLSGIGSGIIYKKLLVPIYGVCCSCVECFTCFFLSKKDKEPVCDVKVRLSKLDEVRVKSQNLLRLILPEHYFKLDEFPKDFPLRCFINPEDSTYKKAGDKIKLLWSGYRIILTCIESSNDWNETSFEWRVATSVHNAINRGVCAKENVDVARALSKTSGKWVRLS